MATWVRNRRARVVVEINDLAVSCLIDRRASRHARIFVSEQQTTSLIRTVDAPPTAGDPRGGRRGAPRSGGWRGGGERQNKRPPGFSGASCMWPAVVTGKRR